MKNAAPKTGTDKVGLKFSLGALVMTRGISELMNSDDFVPIHYVARHASGDWGDMDDEDKEANNEYLATGGRLLSAYDVPFKSRPETTRIWIITEADRSVTTILLPSEY